MSAPGMRETAIRVERLSKRYQLGGGTRSGLLKEKLRDSARGAWRRLVAPSSHDAGRARDDGILWALRDVSFEVERGDVIGIVGHNGAGKSVLLKILSRITAPTSGRAEVHGRTGSLLEVGTGFHPELSGRENIHLNGALLGMARREIQARFDEIVDFAGVGRFIDTPVKHYSSGMALRLAFSVAAHLDADIIFLDEVWAAGDADFQERSHAKMQELIGSGRTVLIVSHGLDQIAALCTRALLFDHGRLLMDGKALEVVSYYSELGARLDAAPAPVRPATPLPRGSRVWPQPSRAPGGRRVRLLEIATLATDGRARGSFAAAEPLALRLRLEVREPAPLVCAISLSVPGGDPQLLVSDLPDRGSNLAPPASPARGIYDVRFALPGGRLSAGRYRLSVVVGTPATLFSLPDVRTSEALELEILADSSATGGQRSALSLPADWKLD